MTAGLTGLPDWKSIMLLGLRTVIYHAPDLAATKAWYMKAFGITPYFDEPFYVGFNVGGYELGLHPDAEGVAVAVGNNAVAYWGVADIDASFKALIAGGARAVSPVMDVGGDIKVASVADPWGNIVGLIYNPHFEARG